MPSTALLSWQATLRLIVEPTRFVEPAWTLAPRLQFDSAKEVTAMMRTALLGCTLLLLSLFPAALSARQYPSATVTAAAYHYDRDCDHGYYGRHRDCADRRCRLERRRDDRYWDRGGYWR
jgi:hypothetical protein